MGRSSETPESSLPKWGVAGGYGKVYLAPADAVDLPIAAGSPETLRAYKRAFGDARVVLRDGMVVRLMDLDGDDQNRPCTLEVDGVVRHEPGRHWYAEYTQSDMVWVPRET